jgi:23S rRNA (adenine-N6)-dimethyltransferase
MKTQQRKKVRLAQNCLRSPALVQRLVAMSTIAPSDTVYEIGAGDGIITAALARIARRVVAIETDTELVRNLRERCRPFPNVEIVEKDFLAWSFGTSEYKIFANIPYNLTSRIVRKILYEQSSVMESYLILQKEAARKFSGCPKETLVSILAKPFFEFQILYQLRRTDFWPVPNVDSVLLAIKRRKQPLLAAGDVAAYREFVRYGFSRWKPNLKLAFKKVFTYKRWRWLARNLDFPLHATATELSVEQWLGLYYALKQLRGENGRFTVGDRHS